MENGRFENMFTIFRINSNRIFKITYTTFIGIRTLINPNRIIPPIIKLTNKFEKIKTVDISLNNMILIGNVAILALIEIHIICFTLSYRVLITFASSLLSTLFGFLYINGYTYIIPIVAINDNIKLVLFILNGFIISITNIAIDRFVMISLFLFTSGAIKDKIDIMHALVTDTVLFVKKMKRIKKQIVKKLVIFLGVFSFSNISVIPNITNDTCIPETANICESPLAIKFCFISSDNSLSPNKIPRINFCLSLSCMLFLTFFFINTRILLAIFSIWFTSCLIFVTDFVLTFPYIPDDFKYSLYENPP